jgi:histidine ammonia-lyase
LQPETLTPGATTLAQLERLFRSGAPAALDPSARAGVEAAAARIAQAAAGETAVYGVNTGFGKLASLKIAAKDTATLQRNLILSHCCGVGEPMPRDVTRLMMALKLLSLGRGASGVRWEIIALLEGMLAAGVTPVIPAQGSVGASGDLAPLAHMAAAMIGEGLAEHGGQVHAGRRGPVPRRPRPPSPLAAKEGLALINGTQFSTAYALAGLFGAWRAAQGALVTSALSTDAIMGSTAPLHPQIHSAARPRGPDRGRRHPARPARRLGDPRKPPHRRQRVQDPYCIRCQPQVTGACDGRAAHGRRHAGGGGQRRHRQPPRARRRLHRLRRQFPRRTRGFRRRHDGARPLRDRRHRAAPRRADGGSRRSASTCRAFLTPNPGLNSGLMIAEVTTAALMSENKQMAHPASVDSTPTSANQEDHVSMACHGARRLLSMTDNLAGIVGIEAVTAAQGIDFRAPLATSALLSRAHAAIRAVVPTLDVDRYMAGDLEAAADLVRSGALNASVGDGVLPGLEG